MWPWADVWTFLASVSWCMYILAWKYRVSVTTRERPLKAETASPFLSFTLPSKSIHIQPLLTILSYQPPPYPVPYRCCKGGGSTSWQLAWLSFLRGCSLSSTQRPQWLSWTEWWWDLTDLRTLQKLISLGVKPHHFQDCFQHTPWPHLLLLPPQLLDSDRTDLLLTMDCTQNLKFQGLRTSSSTWLALSYLSGLCSNVTLSRRSNFITQCKHHYSPYLPTFSISLLGFIFSD